MMRDVLNNWIYPIAAGVAWAAWTWATWRTYGSWPDGSILGIVEIAWAGAMVLACVLWLVIHRMDRVRKRDRDGRGSGLARVTDQPETHWPASPDRPWLNLVMNVSLWPAIVLILTPATLKVIAGGDGFRGAVAGVVVILVAVSGVVAIARSAFEMVRAVRPASA